MHSKTSVVYGTQNKVNWHRFDAQEYSLGRLASQVAKVLLGKHRVDQAVHLSLKDYVIIENCAKVVVTGNKLQDKQYHRHTEYRLKSTSMYDLLKKDPTRIVELAIKGMLPRGPRGREMLRKLRLRSGKVKN